MCLELWENCLSLFFTCCLRLGGVCKADAPLRSERWLQKGICHRDYVGDCGTGKTVLPTADLEKEKLREEAECLSALFAASDLGLILFLPWGETLCQSGFHLLNKAWLCWSLRMTNAIWELSVNITVKIYCNIYRASPSLRQGPLGGTCSVSCVPSPPPASETKGPVLVGSRTLLRMREHKCFAPESRWILGSSRIKPGVYTY